MALLALRHRGSLAGRYALEGAPEPHDKVLLIVASVCCVTLGPAFVAGVVRAIPSAIAAVILGGTVLIRDRSLPRRVSVLWLMGIGASLALLPRNRAYCADGARRSRRRW